MKKIITEKLVRKKILKESIYDEEGNLIVDEYLNTIDLNDLNRELEKRLNIKNVNLNLSFYAFAKTLSIELEDEEDRVYETGLLQKGLYHAKISSSKAGISDGEDEPYFWTDIGIYYKTITDEVNFINLFNCTYKHGQWEVKPASKH